MYAEQGKNKIMPKLERWIRDIYGHRIGLMAVSIERYQIDKR